MHAFQTAASAFCIACICAEITTLLAGAGWAGRCIKAVAGLYILVILFRLAPQMKLELKSAAAAAPAAVSIQSTETSLLQGTQERLEADLCAECERRFGTKVKLEITLTWTEQTVRTEKVLVICAEITTLLAGAGWAGRCIKAVAGLYILVILFRLAPQMKLELKSAAAAAPAAVSIQSTETSLLQGTQERLEADLCAECERRFGTKVKLEITLTWTEQTVRTEKVLVILPAACTSAEQSRIAAYLQQELGMAPILEVQEDTE